MKTVARGVTTRFPQLPLLPPQNHTLTHGEHTIHTALPFTCTRG